MDSQIMVESLPVLGVCNLCLGQGAVKSMIAPVGAVDSEENYANMLLKCFAIDILTLQLGDVKNLVCNQCIKRLIDATQFKQQVKCSLQSLEEAAQKIQVPPLKKESNNQDVQFIVDVMDGDTVAEGSIPPLKKESSFVDEEFIDDDMDADYVPEDSMSGAGSPLDIKMEGDADEDAPKRTRRKTHTDTITKTKSTKKLTAEKMKKLKSTEKLITRGLFPFKIRKNGSFSCAVCPQKSVNLDDIKNHVTQHSTKILHIAFEKMLTNLQRFYRTDDRLCCKLCLSDIATYDDLKTHISDCERLNYGKSNWNLLPFTLDKDQTTCPICKKNFLNYVSLNTHMNEHYPNYICENCGKAFASKSRLRGHIRTHEIGEFRCRYCSAVFDKVTKRENHVSREHKSGVRYSCKRCGLSLTSFYARQKHLAEAHNEELKRYKCNACSQSYITPGHLSSHVRRDHLNERNHKCEKCDLAFYSKNALKMHMIKHGGERIHVCPVCQKSYQRKKTLREHLRIHNNDKRFVCPVCGRAFTQKCTLKAHLKVHEKKYDVDDRLGHLH